MSEKKGVFSNALDALKTGSDAVVSSATNFFRNTKTNDEKISISASVASVVSDSLERGQYAKFHTPGGHGFAAEDANALSDRWRGKRVETVGRSNVLNGADRIADGIAIQTKYCATPSATVRAAFDSKTGFFRYSRQLLEVPKDQYQTCVDLMKQKITDGKVPGVSNPADAETIVKAGEITYRQARNIARAGTIDSLVYDAKNGTVASSYVFGVSYVVVFALRVWRGESPKVAAVETLKTSSFAAATALATGIATAQALRTRAAALGAVVFRETTRRVAKTAVGKWGVENVARASLDKAVFGSAAANHVAKLLRTNVIAGAVTTLVLSGPDAYRAAIKKSISWRQFAKNFGLNAASTAGGASGWFVGATIGTAVAGPVGGVVGGLTGAIGGGVAAQGGAKFLADKIAPDNRAEILRTTEEILARTASDFMLSREEVEEATRLFQTLASSKWGVALKSERDAEKRRERIESNVDEICLAITQNRPALAE